MIKKRKLVILICAILFSLGMASVGYGFWTDHLELEGNASVNINLSVIDDVVLDSATEEAIQLLPEVVLPEVDTGAGNADNSGTGQLPDSIREAVDPKGETPPETVEQTPVIPPSTPAATEEPEQPSGDSQQPSGDSQQPSESPEASTDSPDTGTSPASEPAGNTGGDSEGGSSESAAGSGSGSGDAGGSAPSDTTE